MAGVTDVLKKLLERTREDKVIWKPTVGEQTFVAIVGDLSLMITMDRSNDAVLKILNKEGREIEVLDVSTSFGQHWKSDLNELYQMARRVALKVDSQLDELIRELEKDPDPS